jgi:glycosyltransferase involved in cell wall biosynthesis
MMGRILPYKGLSLFLDAVNTLRAKGLNVQIGVFGDGELGESADRLSMLGAEVVNRWLDASEIAATLARYDVMVVSHTEASQSGVIAMALGFGLPVVATPVGGLVEQIIDGRTGVLARRVDATALAEAIQRLVLDQELYRAICETIRCTRDKRSMERFVEACVAHALQIRSLREQ